ncbi:MAG: hypothetical protein JOZ91_09700 [Candidatus Eremiobacteraeota bacterium]|nr:hypothetical protein [Candidatus Eremiobacteraeota bacterium]MBV8340228.1 hypothetical protein [Candidatus Eremiobacteraeota bacterium]MBV8595889.1 hypothetical protein [Candidatus Eremiobacteraeota bacterium]
MDSDASSSPASGPAQRLRLVGKAATVRDPQPQPRYFTDVHRESIGKTGRVHAIVPSVPKDDPLVKVGFDEGTHIVFFRLADLDVHDAVPAQHPPKHGRRGSHLPGSARS